MSQRDFATCLGHAGSQRAALDLATHWLENAGCPTAREDAEQLVAEASAGQAPDTCLSSLVELCERRARREPLAYILGKTKFCGLELQVDARVFIPRPEAEMLVDVATALPPCSRFHEVATGSGAIALAVKARRADLVVSASDISPEAIEVAVANASRLALDVPFAVAPFLPAGSFDLVSANLPCAPEHHLVTTMPPEEAQFEPRIALTAGPDGLDAIRAFLAVVPQDLRLAVQHIPEQTDAVAALLSGPVTRTWHDGRSCVTRGRA